MPPRVAYPERPSRTKRGAHRVTPRIARYPLISSMARTTSPTVRISSSSSSSSVITISTPPPALLDRDLAALRDAVGERDAATILANGRVLPLREVLAVAAAVAVPGKRRLPTSAGSAPALTRRERQVWELVAAGKSDREIAEALFLSPRTVSWHVGSILASPSSVCDRGAMRSPRPGPGPASVIGRRYQAPGACRHRPLILVAPMSALPL
jgi:DNA-binding CsgD family transcriptional regulator